MTMARTVTPPITLFSNDPRVIRFPLLDGAGDPQILVGRAFLFVARATVAQLAIIEVEMLLSGDGLYVVAPITADHAATLYALSADLSLSYDVVEVTGGASITRWTGRLKMEISPNISGDSVPVWLDLPFAQIISEDDTIAISENGAQGHSASRELYEAHLITAPTVEKMDERFSTLSGLRAGWLNLRRDLSYTSLIATIQRRGLADDNATQSWAVDTKNGWLYTLHVANTDTVSVVCRVPFDDDSGGCLAAIDAMNPSTVIGHQGLDLYPADDGSMRLLATARGVPRSFVMGLYVPGGDFVSDGTWTVFDETFVGANTAPKLSLDGSQIVCRAKLDDQRNVFRGFPVSILAEPGDYSDQALWTVIVPLEDVPAECPVQDHIFDGLLTLLAGYGPNVAGDVATRFHQYTPRGTKVDGVFAPLDMLLEEAGAGALLPMAEPEGFATWRGPGGEARTAVMMVYGKTGFRIAAGISIGWEKRWEAEKMADRAAAAIMALDFDQRLSFDQMQILTAWYRHLIMDGLLPKFGMLYALGGRNIGLPLAFNRINLANPGQLTLTVHGNTADPFAAGYYTPDGATDYLDTGAVMDFAAGYFRLVGGMSITLPRNQTAAGGQFGSQPGGSGWTYASLRRSGNLATVRSQTNVDTALTGVTDCRGTHSLIRRVESEFHYRKNGVLITKPELITTGAPGATSGTTFCIGCASSSFSAMPIATVSMGRPMSDAEDVRWCGHVDDFLTKIGVWP